MFVVRCLILCFKLVKKSFVGRAPPGPAAWGSLQRSPRPPSWIMGKGKERRGKMAEGEGRGGKGRGEKWDGMERKGRGGYIPPNEDPGYGPACHAEVMMAIITSRSLKTVLNGNFTCFVPPLGQTGRRRHKFVRLLPNVLTGYFKNR